MKKIIFLLAILMCLSSSAARVYYYKILANVNDDKFVLVDRYGTVTVIEAKTYCFGFDQDDVILATDDLTSCLSSVIIHTSSGKTCEVWCE